MIPNSDSKFHQLSIHSSSSEDRRQRSIRCKEAVRHRQGRRAEGYERRYSHGQGCDGGGHSSRGCSIEIGETEQGRWRQTGGQSKNRVGLERRSGGGKQQKLSPEPREQPQQRQRNRQAQLQHMEQRPQHEQQQQRQERGCIIFEWIRTNSMMMISSGNGSKFLDRSLKKTSWRQGWGRGRISLSLLIDLYGANHDRGEDNGNVLMTRMIILRCPPSQSR